MIDTKIIKHKQGYLLQIKLPVTGFYTYYLQSSEMSQVLQVLEILEIWICQIFGVFWPPKVTSNCIKQPTEYDCDANNNEVYPNINDNFYPLVNVITRLNGS